MLSLSVVQNIFGIATNTLTGSSLLGLTKSNGIASSNIDDWTVAMTSPFWFETYKVCFISQLTLLSFEFPLLYFELNFISGNEKVLPAPKFGLPVNSSETKNPTRPANTTNITANFMFRCLVCFIILYSQTDQTLVCF